MRNKLPIPRLVEGDLRTLLSTLFLAAGAVMLFALAMSLVLPKDAWMHAFFFRRRFVQWVLLMAFAIGLVHLLRRIPVWLRERKDLEAISSGQALNSCDTMVARRWSQIEVNREESGQNEFENLNYLAEHDEAELDGAYRVSADVVQILPLIGFFGTVFGLSIGLYDSFLKEGGLTPRAFAQSIAIASDNTLLGLALREAHIHQVHRW
jgi:biopolymer transport protein ExbB/TolQ